MTKQRRQEVRAELVELGFWGEDEPGDPLTDPAYAVKLRGRIVERLDGATVITGGVGAAITYLTPREVSLLRNGSEKILAHGDTYAEAVCLAALALPQFLKENPDYAA